MTSPAPTAVCPRCLGTGMFGPPSVFAGRCFRCAPAAEAPAAPRATGWTRAKVITALHNYVLAARSQGADWAPEADSLATIRGLLAMADADVRTRALAALPAGVAL